MKVRFKNKEHPLLVSHVIRENNFDFLRLVLAIIVIYSHSFVVYYGTNKQEPLMKLTGYATDFGSIAVNWFFIISGFLITGSFLNTSTVGNYLTKRILRIVPGFVVAFLLSIFIFGLVGSIKTGDIFYNLNNYFSHVGIKNFIVKLSTLQAPYAGVCFQGNPLPKRLNESLWTIQFEFVCYLIVPLLGYLRLYKKKWAALLLFAVAFTIMILQQNNIAFTYDPYYKAGFFYDPYYYPRFLTYFFAGTCVYLYRDVIPRHVVLAIISILMIFYAGSHGKLILAVMPVFSTYLLFYFAYHSSINFSKFAAKGDFSYGTYLYAWPVQQLVMYYFNEIVSPATVFIFSTLITLILAYFSWHIIEKRCLQLKKSFSRKSLILKPIRRIL